MHYTSDRFWEIDALRGIAIIMMVIYHISYDLFFLSGFPIKIHSIPWVLFQRTTASLFLLLVGTSLTISNSKLKGKLSNKDIIKRNFLRGIKIFIWGFIITLFTLIFLNDGIILFGILHLIGISIIISYPFLEHKYKNLVIGTGIILIGTYLGKFNFDTPYFLWLGFEPKYFFSFDYFPIFPWFGVVLIGIFLGNVFYPQGKRDFNIPEFSNYYIIKILSFLGKHSLKIYLLHQPIIVLIFYIIGLADLSFVMI